MPSYKVLRKKDLEMLLEEIPEVTRGKIELEQYTIPSALAATILWILAFEERGLENKLVLDLGCGTGRLGLGALVMGAQYVVGLDLDYSLLEKARKSAKKLNVYQCFDAICADAHHIPLRKVFDVVVQNPPFGVHRKGYDTFFLKVAFKVARKVYSLHKSSTVEYIKTFSEKEGWISTVLLEEKFPLKRLYPFHRKKVHLVDVSLLAFKPR